MDISMLDYVRAGLDQSKGSWPAISKTTGIPYGTIKRIYYDEDNDPRFKAVQTLFTYFQGQNAA